MLRAPTTESKVKNEAGKTADVPEPERVLHPSYSGTLGFEGAQQPAPSGAAQFQTHFAGLQRTVGNQVVLRRLSGGAPSIQTKLKIGQPGDRYEQEADRAAEQVMRMPDESVAPIQMTATGERSGVQRKCSCGGAGGECESCKEKREEGLLQRKAAGPSQPDQAPPIVQEALRSPGQPLEHGTRGFMESRFGFDFRHVRVSSDDVSARAADAIQAKAFTYGNRIVFGRNEYNPSSAPGLGLIAHELAHTAQQGSAPPSLQTSPRLGAIDDPQEREADVAASAVLDADRIPSLSAGAATVRRAPNTGYKWTWEGEKGIYTTAAGEKTTVTRKFTPGKKKQKKKDEKTTIDPDADFARVFVTVKWCEDPVRGSVQAGVSITDQLEQLLPQMLSSGDPKGVLEKETATPFISVDLTWSEKLQADVGIEADVGRQGVTRVGVGGHVGDFGGSVGVDLPPGGRVSPNVRLEYTPRGKAPKVECYEATLEEEYECSRDVTTPAHDVPINIDLPWEPRTHNLYFDYSFDILTTDKNEYGKKHPEVVARNRSSLSEISKDIAEGYRVSAAEGFTSPEGPMPKGQGGFEGNEALAMKRAIAAREYIATSGRCAIVIESQCFTPSKDGVKVSAGGTRGELYTGFNEKGKELEGRKLAETAVQGFKEAEESTLTDKERETLAHQRGAVAQSEVVYPLLRRATVTLVRAGTRPVTLWTEHLPKSTSPQTVECSADIKAAAKLNFSLKDKRPQGK